MRKTELALLLAIPFCWVFVERSAVAQVSEATVDQVLAALAEVVKDRAKDVASQTVRDRLTDNLCSGKSLVVGRANMTVGGTQECRKQSVCNPDDIFAKSCAFIGGDDPIPLTDVHFLKQLGREATMFAIRLAASDLDKQGFEDQKLGAMGNYLFDVMQDMGRPRPDIDALAQRTLTFADEFGDPKLPSTVLGEVSQFPQLKAFRVALQGVDISHACDRSNSAQKGDDEEKQKKEKEDLAECKKLLSNWKLAATSDCSSAPRPKELQASVDRTFDDLFGPEAPFSYARARPCDGNKSCDHAQLLIRLEPQLYRFSCAPDAASASEAFRQLVYEAVLEKQIYLRAIDPEGKDPAYKAAAEFFGAIRGVKLGDVRREQIARGIRVVANALRAYAGDAAQTAAWFTVLTTDLGTLRPDTAMSLDSLTSLRWENRDHWGSRVRFLRNSVKEFLTLPLLYGYASGAIDPAFGVDAALKAVMNIVDAFSRGAKETPSAEQAVRLLSDVIRSLAGLGAEIQRAQQARGLPVAAARLPNEVLSSAAELLYAAHDRDWVAIPLSISNVLQRQSAVPAEVKRSVRFVRVLMSMYQARSQDEAKGIFEAELQDVSSRRRRWEGFTVDAGALLGAGGGWIWATDAAADVTIVPGRTYIYGLYVPFGVQLAWQRLGLMIYPLDLGAYLVANGDGTSQTPDWHDALRVGGALYFRPSPSIPIDIVAGADYHPRFDGPWAERRLMFTAVLELPLYTVY